ncbi:MAG: lipid-A-disaccharide synthase [Cytophagaceae bacterium]
MKYFIIAGERSGDLHASNLIKELRKKDSSAEIVCWGGDYMESAGARLLRHYKEYSIMGFIEVAFSLRKISQLFKACHQDILDFNPDVLILVDFSGFNLRVAKFAKEHDFKVFYYISPKIWAWNQSRANKVKKLVDRMFVIMPFEEEFYQRYDYKVDYVGNPLKDAISAFKADPEFRIKNKIGAEPIIAILPGSRKQEVEVMLEEMVRIVPFFPGYRFVIAGVSNLPSAFYERFRRQDVIDVVYDQTYDLLSNASAALVTSGTATLETALFSVPQVVVYRASPITYLIVKALIKVKYISLVNLIAGKEVVKELIQSELNQGNLKTELKHILEGVKRSKQLSDYQELQTILGEKGASEKTASLMWKYLQA